MPTGVRILVLGSSGMLGHAVRRRLSECRHWVVEGTQSEEPAGAGYMDILKMHSEEWHGVLSRHNYDYIVNCIGILKPAVKDEPGSLMRAIRVNAIFPLELALAAPDSKIIHMSTDGVFSGHLGRPYVESDLPDCEDAYGRTKALGECSAANVLNIRCSIIGRDPAGKGLVEWVLRSADGAELTGFDDHLWNGVTTCQFADLCFRLMTGNAFRELRGESGIHHFCPNPVTTKYELLCRIRNAAGNSVNIRRGNSGSPLTRTLGSIYSGVRSLYGTTANWDAVIQKAITDE